MVLMTWLPHPKNVCQWNINDFWSSIMYNQKATQRHQPMIIASAAFMGKNASDDISTNP